MKQRPPGRRRVRWRCTGPPTGRLHAIHVCENVGQLRLRSALVVYLPFSDRSLSLPLEDEGEGTQPQAHVFYDHTQRFRIEDLFQKAGFLVELLGARVQRHSEGLHAIQGGFQGDLFALGMAVVQ